jgi:quinol---cytochrome c reductase iron-sulfur subunit
MRFLTRLLFLIGALRAGRPAASQSDGERDVDPREREIVSTPRAEWALVVLLIGAGLLAGAFAVLIAAWPNTQILGGTLGGAFLLLAAALILAGKRVVPQEVAVEERTIPAGGRARDEARELVTDGVEGVTRRKLIVAAAGVTGCGLLGAAALPITAWGPSAAQRIDSSPWRAGSVVVDERGEHITADDIELGSWLTGFPEGASVEDIGSPVVIVRVDPTTLDLPAGREGWAPEGLLAYSKICTHAGCAVSMYRYPLFKPQAPGPYAPGPALVCPCHFSTFDVQRGAPVVFGPAGRPLPQLPLRIGPGRRLEAAGPMSGSVGPAWWGVKRPLT